MAGITHSTPSDGTFSGSGASAWDAAHTITETGGQALTVGAIADGQFLKRSGTTITSAAVSGSSDVVAADAPNTSFDLTNGGVGGAVTILSKSITAIQIFSGAASGCGRGKRGGRYCHSMANARRRHHRDSDLEHYLYE